VAVTVAAAAWVVVAAVSVATLVDLFGVLMVAGHVRTGCL
jgi:hypothetical protein